MNRILFIALIDIGGFPGLRREYALARPNMSSMIMKDDYANVTCGEPRPDTWNIIRDPLESDFPWPALVFGLTPQAVWAWCNDQVNVPS